jgi:hypothetical protein
VKKIKSIKVNIATQDTAEEGYQSYYEERDAQGNVLLEIQYFEDGSLARRVERIFDESQKLKNEKFYSQEGAPDDVHDLSYNESGKLTFVKSTYAGGAIGIKKIENDESSNSETIRVEDEQGQVESKEYRRFDSEGKTLEEALYEGEDQLNQRSEASYDDHGRPIWKKITFEDGYESKNDYEYEMDEEGRVISVKITNEKGEEIFYEEYEFNEKNNIAEHYIESPKQTSIRKYEYDEKDRVILEQRLNGQEQVEQEVHFQYNEAGQLTLKETNTPDGFTVEMYTYEFFE